MVIAVSVETQKVEKRKTYLKNKKKLKKVKHMPEERFSEDKKKEEGFFRRVFAFSPSQSLSTVGGRDAAQIVRVLEGNV